MKHIVVIQNSNTGRFLLKKENDVWNWPFVEECNPEEPMLFNSLTVCEALSNVDVDNMLMDFVDYPKDQLFFIYIRDENLTPDVAWHYLYEFPENVSSFIEEVCDHETFIKKAISPAL